MNEPPLTLRAVSHRYGDRPALDAVDLTVNAGEILALVGRNGAGKTTLIRLVTELLPLQSGTIERHGNRVGYVPQRIVIWPDLTVSEQLEFVCDMQDVARERARAVAAELGIDDRWDTLGAALSGGMQRRLSIAIATLHRPGILVLDEPNAGLDPHHRSQLRSYLQSMARDGTAILVSSHDLAEVERVADRVALLEDGRLSDIGTVAEIAGGKTLEARFE